MYRIRLFSLLILVFLFEGIIAEGSISEDERVSITKFRTMVSDLLYKDYMRLDGYLIPWIRAGKMDLNKAKSIMLRTHQWRKDNKLDMILTEDWSKHEKVYPYYVNIVDRTGGPGLLWPIGPIWKVRKVVVAGKLDELRRYNYRMFEDVTSRAAFRVSNSTESQNNFQWTFIVDANGFNGREHVCLGCVQIYVNMIHDIEYYPESVRDIYLINLPRVLETLLRVLRPILSEFARNALKTYVAREEWKPVLAARFPPEQLTSLYGGTRQKF